MALDEDACAICEGDRSTNKNPIMFCDGNECNVPVHKDCYGVDEIPDGEWYCQRCEARRNSKPARIVCCPQESGAFKTTMKPGNFMHIVCAKFNPAINHDREPYNVNRLRLDEQQCYKCEQTQGYCTRCEEDGCEKWFHLTCGINAGLIPVSKKVPDNFSPRCNEHQPQETIKKRLIRRFGSDANTSASSSKGHPRRRRLIKRDMMESSHEEDNDDSQNEQDGESEEEEEEEEEEEDEEEEEEEQEDSDDDMGTKNKKKRKTPLKKRRATAPHAKKGGPIRLFMSDQSDSDDQMGSSNSSSSVTKPRGMLDLIEAKRKKSQLEKQKLALQPTTSLPSNNNNNINNMPSTPSSSSSSSHHSPVVSAAVAAPVTPPLQLQQNKPSAAPPSHKQKLPNKAHLMPNPPNNGAVKKPPVFRDLDDLQNDIVAQRRTISTPAAPSIPPSPYDAPVNGERRNTLPNQKPALYQQGLPPQPRRSMEPPPNDINDIHKALIRSKITEIMEEVLAQPTQAKQNNVDESLRQELQRVREENRRLLAFRRNVAEVFEGLNVKVPSGQPVSVDKIEDYVSELRSMFVRSGAVREQDHARITQYVEDMIIEQL